MLCGFSYHVRCGQCVAWVALTAYHDTITQGSVAFLPHGLVRSASSVFFFWFPYVLFNVTRYRPSFLGFRPAPPTVEEQMDGRTRNVMYHKCCFLSAGISSTFWQSIPGPCRTRFLLLRDHAYFGRSPSPQKWLPHLALARLRRLTRLDPS